MLFRSLDTRSENNYGNICDKTFEEIWTDGFFKFRKKNIYDSKICFSCINSKTRFSPKLISTRKERELWGKKGIAYPKSAVLEISGICNYACTNCFTNKLRNFRKPFYDFNIAKSNLKGLLQKIERLRMYNWGEPLLHKDFCQILKWIRDTAPDLQIDISTNGMLLDDKNIAAIVDNNVNKIIISAHGGPGTENMLKYSNKNANYDKVIVNTEKLISYRNIKEKKLPFVSLKAVLFDWNDSDEAMNKLRQDGKRVKADRVFWVLDAESGLTDKSSKRFKRGSEELLKLVRAGELDGYSE